MAILKDIHRVDKDVVWEYALYMNVCVSFMHGSASGFGFGLLHLITFTIKTIIYVFKNDFFVFHSFSLYWKQQKWTQNYLLSFSLICSTVHTVVFHQLFRSLRRVGCALCFTFWFFFFSFSLILP